eukprot:jgi/Mesvir1/3643/Mv14939-RA.2
MTLAACSPSLSKSLLLESTAVANAWPALCMRPLAQQPAKLLSIPHVNTRLLPAKALASANLSGQADFSQDRAGSWPSVALANGFSAEKKESDGNDENLLDMSPSTSRAAGGVLKINIDLMLYKARKLRRRGQFAMARALFERCLQADSTDGRAYVALAKMAELEGKNEEARNILQQGVTAVGGDNAFLWQAWAVLEARMNNPSKARALFDAATVADSRHAAAWHGWGMLELNEGNVRRARDLFMKGAKLCAGNAFLYQSLGLLEAQAGRLDEARHFFKLGTRTQRGSPALWQAWALLEAKQGNHAEAQRLFELGVKECPRSRYLWLAYGLWESKTNKNVDAARKLLQTGSALNPRDAALLQAWALLEYESGNSVRARELFEAGVVADPKHQPVWQAWAVMEWKLGHIAEARQLFQRGVWAAPDSKNVARVFQVGMRAVCLYSPHISGMFFLGTSGFPHRREGPSVAGIRGSGGQAPTYLACGRVMFIGTEALWLPDGVLLATFYEKELHHMGRPRLWIFSSTC